MDEAKLVGIVTFLAELMVRVRVLESHLEKRGLPRDKLKKVHEMVWEAQRDRLLASPAFWIQSYADDAQRMNVTLDTLIQAVHPEWENDKMTKPDPRKIDPHIDFEGYFRQAWGEEEPPDDSAKT